MNDTRLDALLATWAEAHEVPQLEADQIRQAVLSAPQPMAFKSVDWWQAVFASPLQSKAAFQGVRLFRLAGAVERY